MRACATRRVRASVASIAASGLASALSLRSASATASGSAIGDSRARLFSIAPISAALRLLIDPSVSVSRSRDTNAHESSFPKRDIDRPIHTSCLVAESTVRYAAGALAARAFSSAAGPAGVESTSGAPRSSSGAADAEGSAESESASTAGSVDAAAEPGGLALPRKRPFQAAYAQAAEDGGGGWVVMLDARMLQTPAKRLIRLPSAALAHALAAEWEWQESAKLRPYTMPLMKLVCTAVDQIPTDRDKVVAHLLRFFHTDTVLTRTPLPAHHVHAPALPSSSPSASSSSASSASSASSSSASPLSVLADSPTTGPPLQDLQAAAWDPLLDWIETEYGARPSVSYSLLPPDQPDAAVRALRHALQPMDPFHLAAVDFLAGATRSLVLALAVARGRLQMDEAMDVIRVEEDFQTDRWGVVEGGHDIDASDLRVRVAAVSVFVRLLSLP
ncbi:hypothetical protein CLOM_g16112 [Closterium sp. NIES-68]|nr:hypothetical protein CLOM_g16112 [Closterium sp. NIES-68]GJP58595.1 hypothetical protein CLOP_g702 [Closterium sp. NIES-67]